MIEPTITALSEPGHIGYQLSGMSGRVVVDAPLTIDVDPVGIIAIIETSISSSRVSGGRLIAEPAGLPVLGPVSAPAIQAVSAGSTIGDVVVVRSVLDEPDRLVLTTINESTVLIGSLDSTPGAIQARRALAAGYPAATFLGSAGWHTAAELASLTPPPPSPLNRHAIALTNRGEGDLYWADPRFSDPARPMSQDELTARLTGPWLPTIVCLDTGVDVRRDGARHIPADSLASSVGALAGEREIVVESSDLELAQAAAGFLVRLGMNAAWVEP